jgi:flagellar biosynthesis protein FliQ
MKPLLISKNTTLIIAIMGALISIFGAWIRIYQFSNNFIPNSTIFLSIGLVMSLIAWFVVFYDIMLNPLRNKFLWIIGMFFASLITVIFYLLR